MTFGAALEVKGAVNDVYCYSQEITDTHATFTGFNMMWEKWIEPLSDYLDESRARIATKTNAYKRKKAIEHIYENEMMCLYYQEINGERIRLTLPAAELKEIKKWIDKYLADEKAEFPYKGNVQNADVAFTIDFAEDVEIVKAFDGIGESNKRRGNITAKNHVDEIAAELEGNEWRRKDIINLKSKGVFDRAVEKGELVKVKGKHGYYQRKQG